MAWRVASVVALCLVLCSPAVQAYLSPLFMSSGDVAPPPVSDLAIHLPLQGNFNDISGNGNNGTPNGAPTFGVASWGTALNCDGVDDRIDIAADASFNNLTTYTFAACITPSSYGEGNFGRLMSWELPTTDEAVLWFLNATTVTPINNIRMRENRYATTSGVWGTDADTIALGTTYHVAFTYDQSTNTAQHYINGVAVNTQELSTPAGAFTATTAALRVCNRFDSSSTFDGFLGHFRLYTSVKNVTEIAALQQSDCPPAAAGGTFYVRTGGSDANNCSDAGANACATIQRAHDLASCGDTVDVGAGTFADMRTVVSKVCTSGNRLTIRGAGQGSTTIDGDTPISSLPGPPTWTLEGAPTYPGNNVYSIALGLGRLAHMRNGATNETFRLISDSCMDGTRNDCWSSATADGDFVLNQSATALYTTRDPDVNAWNASSIRYGTKSNNRTYFREKDALNPSTLDIRVCASSGNDANVFTVTGSYITIRDMTIIGCRRWVYITGSNNIVQDTTGRNTKQGFMNDGGSNNLFQRITAFQQYPWVTTGGRDPSCAWEGSNGEAHRSNCALYRSESKTTTGETTIRMAGVWFQGGSNNQLRDSEVYNFSNGVFYFSGNDVTVANNYLRNASSGGFSIFASTFTGLEVYDNRFYEATSGVQTTQVSASSSQLAYFYNNRFYAQQTWGKAFQIRGPSPAASLPNVEWYVYHNSSSGHLGGFQVSSLIDALPLMVQVNNIWDNNWWVGTARTGTFLTNGMRCSNYNWTRGNDTPRNPWHPTPNNIDSGGVKAWDDTGLAFLPDPTWATIPASAQNAGIDAFSGTWTCRSGVTSLSPLPWNSSAPQPGSTPNMGWQQ